jgi:hypothetical protein
VTLFVMSMVFVVDVTTISCRPWSAVRPGKARPHSRLVEPLKLRPVLSLLRSFRRKSNLYLMLLSQGDAIEAYILKPFTPNLPKSNCGFHTTRIPASMVP